MLINARDELIKTICYQPGSEQNKTEIIERFQATAYDQIVFLFSTTNLTGSRENLLLLFSSRNSLSSLIVSSYDSSSSMDQLMLCTNYSRKNVEAAASLLIPRDSYDIETYEEWNALLILCAFYSQDNLIDLVNRLIIDNFVDVTTVSAVTRFSPLTLLCRYYKGNQMVQIAELLIEQGVDVSHQDVYGHNALTSLLRWSESDKILEVAQLLIAMGVDINKANNYLDNGLMLLCHYSKSDKILQLAKLLLSKGIDINQINLSYGQNALMELCQYSKNNHMFQMAQLLISEGIDVNHTNRYGETALDLLNQRSSTVDGYKVTNKLQLIQLIQSN